LAPLEVEDEDEAEVEDKLALWEPVEIPALREIEDVDPVELEVVSAFWGALSSDGTAR
jgi:hypothetical protein